MGLKINFTDKFVKSASTDEGKPEQEFYDLGLKGLSLRVTQSGRKTFCILYRFNGTARRYSIGTYPTIGLSIARAEAKRLLADVTLGVDVATRKTEKKNDETFEYLANDYIENYAKREKSSWADDLRLIGKDINPRIGSKRVKEITRRDINDLLAFHLKRGVTVHANRVLALVRRIFNYGIENDFIDYNPCLKVKAPVKEHSRTYVIPEDDLRKFIGALDGEKRDISSLFLLMILSLQRGKEVRTVEWADLDLENDIWSIPAEKTKNGVPTTIPITPLMRTIFERQRPNRFKSTYVFPSPKNPKRHVANVQKAIQRVRKSAKVNFVGHDFRRTAATRLAERGVTRFVCSLLLNHKESGVTKIYERYGYHKELREALLIWDAWVTDAMNENTKSG